jgi:hypothetical protein
MRARWNGPGSLSTTSGAARPGTEFNSEQISEASFAELVANGRITLLERMSAPAAQPAAPPPVASEPESAPVVVPESHPVIVPPPPSGPAVATKAKGKRAKR